MNPIQYDAIIIGSGQAGGPLSRKLAKSGKKVLLVEKRWIGGTCINDGCTPTKTWVASAKIAYVAAKAEEMGIVIPRYSVDMARIKRRKDQIVEQARKSNQASLEKTEHLDLLFGEASFIGPKTISIKLNEGGVKHFKADLIFINTGDKPRIPEIKGLQEINYLTSTTILDLDTVPDHLLIIGGNYVGLEFGQMFRRFGSKVTILERSASILSREDSDIAAAMQEILALENIDILTDSLAAELTQKTSGGISVTVSGPEGEKTIECTHLLIAAGRVPQTGALDLNKAGVETDDKGSIKVNDRLETNVPGIYALGDVKGGPAFTHISYNDFVIVYQNLLEKKNRTIENRSVPYCVFTDPQLGRIGLSETEAKKQGLDVKVATMPMAHVARAIETGDTRGLMKALVDAKTGKILGAAILGANGGEIMSVLQMAMEGDITYDRIKYFIFAHPLYSESLNNLFTGLED